MTRIGPGTLKCIVAPPRAGALSAILAERVNSEDIRPMGPGVLLVHTALEPSGLRDWLSGYLEEDESLLVVEFERWSTFGENIDREWLLARGH